MTDETLQIKEDSIFGEVPPEFDALDEKEEAEEEIQTLDDFGQKLPIGYEDARGETHREFELREWDFELEEELGKVAENEPDMPMGQYLSEVVGSSISRLGGIDVTKLKRSERRLLLYRMYYADVLYLYVHIRINALGPEIRFERFPCQKFRCPQKIDYVGDLRTIEVVSLDEPPRKVVELDDGLFYGGEYRKRVVVGGLRWAWMEATDAGFLQNSAKFKQRTLEYGVVGVEGVKEGTPIVIDRENLRRTRPREINKIVAAVNDSNAGPLMILEGACPRCETEFALPIDWRYESFFGISSP